VRIPTDNLDRQSIFYPHIVSTSVVWHIHYSCSSRPWHFFVSFIAHCLLCYVNVTRLCGTCNLYLYIFTLHNCLLCSDVYFCKTHHVNCRV